MAVHDLVRRRDPRGRSLGQAAPRQGDWRRVHDRDRPVEGDRLGRQGNLFICLFAE